MPVLRPPFAILLVLLSIIACAGPAHAAERTFLFTGADVVRMIDEFNADVLAHSASLRGAVKLHQGAVSIAGKSCPSLALHIERRATRLRVLDGPERAAVLAARRPNEKLASLLAAMGGTTWSPPGAGRTRRTAWSTQSMAIGTTAFATDGYATGDSANGISGLAVNDVEGSFAVGVELPAPAAPVTQPELVLAVTTELPRRTLTSKPKRTECYLVAPAPASDLQALEDLLAATSIPEPSATSLANLLVTAETWLGKRRPDRAALLVKRFSVRVATLSATDVPADAAEALVMTALRAAEALSF
jgi:hypothetical protein